MKLSRKRITAALELVIVLLATILAFRAGVAIAKVERGCVAYGGEYLLLMIPVFYYVGKQILQDWLSDLRQLPQRGDTKK